MARTHNPFAPVERSKVQTPWGEFQIAPPNKARLAEIDELQREAAQAQNTDAESGALERMVELGIRTAAAGVENGDALLSKLQEAWDAGEVTVDQVRSLAEFVAEEIAGEVKQGNE